MTKTETEVVQAAIQAVDAWMQQETDVLVKRGGSEAKARALQRRDELADLRRKLIDIVPQAAG